MINGISFLLYLVFFLGIAGADGIQYFPPISSGGTSGALTAVSVTSPLSGNGTAGSPVTLNYAAAQFNAMSGTLVINTGGIGTGELANDAVTFAKLQNLNAVSLFGNATGGATDGTNITLATPLAFSGSTVALQFNATNFANSGGTLIINNGGVGSAEIANNSVALGDLATLAASSLIGNATGGVATPTAVTLSTPLAFSGSSIVEQRNATQFTLVSGSLTLNTNGITGNEIASNTVPFGDIVNLNAVSLFGNPTGGATSGTNVTLATPLAFSGSAVALQFNTTNFANSGGTLIINTGGVGSAEIANNSVALGDLATLAASSLIGNATGGVATPTAVTLVSPLVFSGTTITTSVSQGKALGRFAGAGTGPAQELTFGTGLSVDAGGTITASSSGAGTMTVTAYTSGTGTITKTTGAKTIEGFIWASGSSGGTGRRGAVASLRGGGGGGAGGAFTHFRVPATTFGATYDYSIGAGGAAKTGPAADSTDGSTGNNGAQTFVRLSGSSGTRYSATNGSAGAGGTAASGGIGGSGSLAPTASAGDNLFMFSTSALASQSTIGDGGGGSNGTVAATTVNVAGSMAVPSGGGGGGGVAATNVATLGGSGGNISSPGNGYSDTTTGGNGGNAANGSPGTSPSNVSLLGGSGGGGGGGGTTTGFNGGDGGVPGGGGGGSGGSTNGNTSGNSGAGGVGLLVLIEEF